MEITPTVVISGLVALVVILTAFAGIVGGFVRLESKTNANGNDINELYREVEKHRDNRNVHHDGDELDRRFGVLTEGMNDIKEQVKDGFKEITHRMDNFIKSK